jgi:hypothetical protein
MKRVTQLSLTRSLATDDAKFFFISFVGVLRRAVSSSIYATSSSSCHEVSFCCAIACSFRERVSLLHVRVNVDRTAPCFAAILDHGISSSDAKLSHSMGASCNPLVLCCCGAETIKVFWWFGALRTKLTTHKQQSLMGFLVSPLSTDNVCDIPYRRALRLNDIISHANLL